MVLKLELRCPRNVQGISADPDPDWNFDHVLEELNSLELSLCSSSSSKLPLPFAKSQSRDLPSGNSSARNSRPFVMRVSANDFESDDDDDDDALDRNDVVVTRFDCQDLYLSDEDESEDGLGSEVQPILMDEVGLVEGALFEKTFEHRLNVKGEIRNAISAIESCLTDENDKSNAALLRVEKYREARRDSEKKLDTQYQRKIAEALDSHLTVIQRDHELQSQIEERKISAAIEGVKRKEKALLEEKLRQEKARAEAEAKLRAEEARKDALEAQIRTEKEAAEREAAEAVKKAADKAALDEASRKQANPSLDKQSSVLSGEIIRAAENALKLEQGRLKRLEEIDVESKRLGIDSMKEYSRFEKQISKVVRQISATADIIRKKAAELVNILKTSPFPQSISSRAFARKVILKCQFSGAAFARAYVIVLVSSEVPNLMDVILAELHKACIYTVPKHIMYSKSAFESREAYYKTIGFKEEEGKIEDVDSYLKELEGYVKLYGALVQTEIPRIQNPHGLKEGWAWMARFVNTLPANRFTAVALNSFLNMAGYALFQKYKSQFGKILMMVSDNFLIALKDRKDVTLNEIMANIRTYIEDSKFRMEPEGRSLEAASLLSEDVMSASNSHHNNQGYNNNNSNYYRY